MKWQRQIFWILIVSKLSGNTPFIFGGKSKNGKGKNDSKGKEG
jgi:hypothetical protein